MITPALAFGLYAGVCYLIGYAHGRVTESHRQLVAEVEQAPTPAAAVTAAALKAIVAKEEA